MALVNSPYKQSGPLLSHSHAENESNKRLLEDLIELSFELFNLDFQSIELVFLCAGVTPMMAQLVKHKCKTYRKSHASVRLT